MSEFVDKIVIDGQVFEFDSDNGVARIHCSACGLKNDVVVNNHGEQLGWLSFPCENCGHVIVGMGKTDGEIYDFLDENE